MKGLEAIPNAGHHRKRADVGPQQPHARPEQIVGVAARFDDGLEFRSAAPSRHNVVLMMAEEVGRRHPHPWKGQGFYTDQGRFLDRMEAIPVAQAAGQISEPKWPPYLYSEDLW
jgi:hypothetical protein